MNIDRDVYAFNSLLALFPHRKAEIVNVQLSLEACGWRIVTGDPILPVILQELATIKSGGIWYKKALVYAVEVRIFGNTAILLEDIDLQAVVGGHEVANPFMVTEVYIKENGKWKLAQLTFSHLLRPVKMNNNNT